MSSKPDLPTHASPVDEHHLPQPLGRSMIRLPLQWWMVLTHPQASLYAREKDRAAWGLIWIQILVGSIVIAITLFLRYYVILPSVIPPPVMIALPVFGKSMPYYLDLLSHPQTPPELLSNNGVNQYILSHAQFFRLGYEIIRFQNAPLPFTLLVLLCGLGGIFATAALTNWWARRSGGSSSYGAYVYCLLLISVPISLLSCLLLLLSDGMVVLYGIGNAFSLLIGVLIGTAFLYSIVLQICMTRGIYALNWRQTTFAVLFGSLLASIGFLLIWQRILALFF